jgi:uncharacterized protein (DUF305 family)
MKQSIIFGIVGLILGAVISGSVVANQLGNNTANSNVSPTAAVPNSMDGMSHGEMSMGDMSMGDMMMELDGKTGDDFDKVFLQSMIMHHQGAIDMANAAKERAGHEELKQMADDIISAQDAEIKQMQQWQKDWGYTQ